MTSTLGSSRYTQYSPTGQQLTNSHKALPQRGYTTDMMRRRGGRSNDQSRPSRVVDNDADIPSTSSTDPPSFHNTSHLPYTAQQYHNGSYNQDQVAYYNQYAQQWAEYWQYAMQAGNPQLQMFTPATSSMSNAYPPNQQSYAGFSMNAQAQYGISSKRRRQKPRAARVNTQTRSFMPNTYQPQNMPHVEDVGVATDTTYSQDGYGMLRAVRPFNSRTWRVNKAYRTSVANEPNDRKNKHKDPKIMLPAPQPTAQYLLQAAGKPEVVDPPDLKLVILDLNGTLLFRPNPRKQPTKMIGRPFLSQFLEYLFENFAVMIWSSAKPANVKILVERGLENYNTQLVATWARDTLGLAPHHYNRNVQCYKDLKRVWVSDEVQCNMLDYEEGKRFDQRNTILLDDSAIKASAQPHNLLEVPEFSGISPDAINQDVLGEVVGYLELLKMQEDVSKFIHKTPFKADGTWSYAWHNLASIVGDGSVENKPLEPVVLGEK